MDHPFTPPARIPASLPTPKKEKREVYFGIPQTSAAHLTEEEHQQLTRSSFEATRPVFPRSRSRELRSGSQYSAGHGGGHSQGRSGSASSISQHTSSSAGLTGLDPMQTTCSSSANIPSTYPHTQDIPHLTGLDLQLPVERRTASISSATSDTNGRELVDSNDGPSAPASLSHPHPSEHYLTGSNLHLPDDGTSASASYLNGADLQLPADDISSAIQSPYPPAPHTIDELETSASVAALLLKKLDDNPTASNGKLPVDDSSAPIPPPLPIRKEPEVSYEIITTTTVSYEMIPPPRSVVALISNLGGQGDSSSDPNWPLPARTPVFTFIPSPPNASPTASSLEASIPSNVPSPIGSPFTASQQQPMNSFIPPPHTIPTSMPSSIAGTQQQSPNSFIPPPHAIQTSIAPYNQPFAASVTPNSMTPLSQDPNAVAGTRAVYNQPFSASATPNSMVASNHDFSATNPLAGAIAGFNQASNRPPSAQPPVELPAFQNTVVQNLIPRVPVPPHGSMPNYLTKPQSAAFIDAALAKHPPFRHTSQLNHFPNIHPMMTGQPQPGQTQMLQAPPIDKQLPVLAPSLHIETVPSFPNHPAKEPSFWRRRKKTLIILLVCVMLGIAVGIVFVAHSFYERWGGVGFLKKRDLQDNSLGYLQASNGDVLAHQRGGDGRKVEKGLLEGMLMGGYKRGWGTDFTDEDIDPAPVTPKKVKHIKVIPVGSDTILTNPFEIDSDIGPSWWNDRINEMQKRGEELINAYTTPEDAFEQAAALVQHFAEEIKARAQVNPPACPPVCRWKSDISDGTKPPARLFEADGSDKGMLPQEMAISLASDYVNRIPEDVANNYDVEILMASMDTKDMKRPAQEVAMLAAKGYIARVLDMPEMLEARSIVLGARGVLSKEDITKLNMGEDIPESVTITVTKTRMNTEAPTGLGPQDRAKQFASSYAESIPHEVELGSLSAKRFAARTAKPDVMPWSALSVASPQDVAKANAGHYARQAPDHEPLKRLEKSHVKESAELQAAQFLAALKSEETVGRWADDEVVKVEDSMHEEAKRKNVPFTTCGDQRHGCEAHGHPEICCPVKHTCHKSSTTNSGVICCPGLEDCVAPGGEVIAQVYCPPNTVACPVEMSGGCCLDISQCSPNGCLEFEPGYSPSDEPAKATIETRPLTITLKTPVAPGQSEVLAEVSTTVTEQVGGDVRVTATVAKDGEVYTGSAETKAVNPKPKKSGGEKRRWPKGWGEMLLELGGVAFGMVWM